MDEVVRIRLFRPLKDDTARAGAFIRAATDYSRLGLDCFNQCIDPGSKVSEDTLRGMEKRCMDGCLTVNLQNFTIYGTQFGQ